MWTGNHKKEKVSSMKTIESQVNNQNEIRPTLSIIRPVADPSELIAYHQGMRRMIRDSLIEGTDYGTIPGVQKPCLFKPGAEKINIAFGCFPRYERIAVEADHFKEVIWQKKKKVWNNGYKGDRTFRLETEEGKSLGLYRYVYKCRIVRSDGRELGEGEGVCSTLESKFSDRPRDCENNVCKMAQKRAFLAGTLNAFGLSDCFTQDMDVEDNFPKVFPPINGGDEPKQSAKIIPIYNQNDEKMRAGLAKILDGKGIYVTRQDEISRMMNGKQFTLSVVNSMIIVEGK